jgi:hypothetical protein
MAMDLPGRGRERGSVAALLASVIVGAAAPAVSSTPMHQPTFACASVGRYTAILRWRRLAAAAG